ncbi:hypothetical protein BG011_003956, partial [Mortierella polycephala]
MYSDKCKKLRLKHVLEDCYRWQNDQKKKKESEGGSNYQSKDAPRPLKTIGAFTRVNEDAQLEGIQLNKESFFAPYSSSPYVNLKHAYAFKGPAA